MVNDVKPGGVFMINCQWDFDELNHHLKADAKRYIAKNNIQLYTINAIDLAIKIGMGKRNNTIPPVRVLPPWRRSCPKSRPSST